MEPISCDVFVDGIKKSRAVLIYEDGTTDHYLRVEASGRYGDDNVPLSVSFYIDKQDLDDFPIEGKFSVTVNKIEAS